MDRTRKIKVALFAAASVLAGAAALAPAQASDVDQAAYPAVVEAASTPIPLGVGQSDDQKSITPGKLMSLAALAGALAGLVRLVGAGKIARAAGKTVGRAAEISVQGAAGAVRAVRRAIVSPLRFSVLMAGLALFALTGVWLYDIEWIGGLIAGAALAGAAAYGAMKSRTFFRRINPLKSRKENTVNVN